MPTDAIHLSDDLLFASKVTGAATASGLSVALARTTDVLLDHWRRDRPRCLILDLQHPGLVLDEVMTQLRGASQPRVVAYGSHVDTAALKAARSAGCDPVLPRSAFVEQLDAKLPEWCRPQPSDESCLNK